MNDVSGSRFLRMAGSDGFQRALNRSSQPTGTEGSSVGGGDFSIQPVPGSAKPYNPPSASTGPSGSFDYSMLDKPTDTNQPSSLSGPGSFGKQVEREKFLEDNNIAQGEETYDSFSNYGKYIDKNNELQSGSASDGMSIANKYIQNAARTNPIDVVALDKSIRQRPLYHEAKSKLEGLKTYGDAARWSRENLSNWSMPDPMKGVESPDFGSMYKRSKDDLDELEI